ncbi:MAG: hypothetical protein JNL74_22165 [Fibrobacteres bacterium]|nr:hypothetical protein [Fibrobacterota bacterium]
MITHIKQDKDLSNIPIVVISGTFSGRYEGDPESSMNADAVFSKPFDLAKMRKKIDELLARQS